MQSYEREMLPVVWAMVFDVDGVIADTEALNAKASVAMFQQLYGVIVRPEDFRPFVGTGDERYVEGVAEKYGIVIDTQAAVNCRARIFFEMLQSKPLPPTPGLRRLVDAARRRKEVRLAIATSGQKAKQFPVIEGTGLRLDWFDVIVTGDDVTRKKPAPQIYALTAQRLCLAPERCVVFEDAPVGVQAARAAGCHCVAVTSTVGAEELAEADMVVENLTEVSLRDLERLVRVV
ncbi:MAG: HAD family hydrolase [Candidatus Zipacnadales bacterium]